MLWKTYKPLTANAPPPPHTEINMKTTRIVQGVNKEGEKKENDSQ